MQIALESIGLIHKSVDIFPVGKTAYLSSLLFILRMKDCCQIQMIIKTDCQAEEMFAFTGNKLYFNIRTAHGFCEIAGNLVNF